MLRTREFTEISKKYIYVPPPKVRGDMLVSVRIPLVSALALASAWKICAHDISWNSWWNSTKFVWICYLDKSMKENPQKLTQLSSRSHPRHLVGKRTAQKDTTIDTTSDRQVNSNFPYRWSSETDSIKFKISSKTPRGKKESTKRHHHRHHKRQPGEQQFPTG